MVQTIQGIPLADDAIARHLEMASGLRLPGFDTEDFRISLAGAQEKTAFLWHQETWQKPVGATPSTHIFKLPLGVIGGTTAFGAGSIENEWLCSRIVAAYGLPIAEARMARFGAMQALIVNRFDRRLSRDGRWWMRLPTEDFCQVKGLPSEKKYEAEGGPGIDAVLQVLAGSSEPEQDRENFLKAQIVFWLLAAPDGHAKNFSIFLGPQGTFRLAPLYDVLSTARRNGLRRVVDSLIVELIERTPEVVSTVQSELPPVFPEQIAASILDGLEGAAKQLASDPWRVASP